MSDERPAILVLGATGTQGGAVARHLSKQGSFRVLAVTRNVSSAKARKLEELPNVALVQCDANNATAVGHAFVEHAPIHGVYSVQTNDLSKTGAAAEVAQGKLMADLCAKHGVKHLVYGSVCNLQPASGYDILTKAKVEEYIKASGVRYTMLRPTYFIENFFQGSKIFPATAKRVGYPGFDARSEVKQQFILIDDLGMIAAKVFSEGERWFGHTLELAGDELTPREIVKVFSEHTGRQMKAWNGGLPLWALRGSSYVSREAAGAAILFQFMRDTNWKADISKLRAQFPELHTMKGALEHMNYTAPSK